jgi:tetratricopeptide (TPR) repeat protein
MAILLAALAGAAVPALAAKPRETVLEQLRSRDANIRRGAAERLGRVGRQADAKSLVRLLTDSEAAVRKAAEAALWQIWSRSGDARVDAVFKRGVSQMNSVMAEAAVASFSEVIRLKPDFAEGWNKRATVLYFLGRNEESLSDCLEVLKRNPEHFGALSGMGQVYARLDDYERALESFERALAINPNLAGVAANIEGLRRIIEERARRTT